MYFALALTFSTVVACANPVSKESVFRGRYNFENSHLTPDGKDEAWCINSDMSKTMLPADNNGQQWGSAHIVVRGILGPEGRYGGLESCNRVLEVTEILAVTDKRGQK